MYMLYICMSVDDKLTIMAAHRHGRFKKLDARAGEMAQLLSLKRTRGSVPCTG